MSELTFLNAFNVCMSNGYQLCDLNQYYNACREGVLSSTEESLGSQLLSTSMAPVFEVKSANDCDDPDSDFSINKADITVVTSRKKMTLKYGSIKNVGFDMKSIEEKPEIEFIVNAGIYVLKKSCLKFLKKNTKFDIPQLLKILKSKRK